MVYEEIQKEIIMDLVKNFILASEVWEVLIVNFLRDKEILHNYIGDLINKGINKVDMRLSKDDYQDLQGIYKSTVRGKIIKVNLELCEGWH